MRTSAKILRTIGLGLTWSGWEYAAPRHYGPWALLGTPYYLYHLPSPPTESARPASSATPRTRQGGG
jgi:hypothetical protein